MGCMSEPIKGKPNAIDDDTINRGVSGQSLRDTGMHYDPATGKPDGEAIMVNEIHNPGMSEVPNGY